jgi:eukaryotic-like serine/threonine-protein kinase
VSGQDWQGSDPGPAPDESGLIGSVVAGRYRILRRLGEGATAAVFVGEHLKIGRHDAIKILFGAVAADPESSARFLRGARNVSSIRHPNVCTIYDFGETEDGLQFMAMELVPGEALSTLLGREGFLPPERAIEIAHQVADALQAAHDAGIVHRDLKPGNIMVSRDRDGGDSVKVVDFDIAKGPAGSGAEGPELTRAGFVIGTPEYMSPEQLTGETLDGRSDVYSLGVVLFRMLTGSLPFRSRIPQDLMVERLTKPPLRLDEVTERQFPAQIQRVLDRALARRPGERQASAAEFARELEAAREPAPPPTIYTPAHQQSPRPGPAVWAAAAVVVLALGAGGLAFHWRSAGSESPRQEADAGAAIAAPADDPDADKNGESRPDPGRTEPREDATAQRDVTATPTPDPPRIDPGPTRPAGPRLDAAEVDALLWRQFDAMAPEGVTRGQLSAIRDTAQMVWNQTDLPRADRAFAAFLVGSTHAYLDNSRECVTWLERAIGLRPDGPGYQALLDNCRGGL